MLFGELHGLTKLPVEYVQHRFRNEDVITVLPAQLGSGRDCVLVATPSKVAVVSSEVPSGSHWMTYWAPWDVVHIDDDEATSDGSYGLFLGIGSLRFHTRLRGPGGQRALREFVVAIQERRSAVAALT
jgi:hypothetical protein